MDMTPQMSECSPQLWCVRWLPLQSGVEYLFHKAYEECLRTVVDSCVYPLLKELSSFINWTGLDRLHSQIMHDNIEVVILC